MEKQNILNYDINEKYTFETNHEKLYNKIQEILDVLTDNEETDKMKSLCVDVVEIKSLLKGKYKVNKNDIEFIKNTTNNIFEKLLLYIQHKNEPIFLLNTLIKEVIEKQEKEDNEVNNLRHLNKKLINEIKELKNEIKELKTLIPFY